ncbi:heterodisulfide reductase-related iron-sulfur binding cluster, partial [Solemya velum gill symbiont]
FKQPLGKVAWHVACHQRVQRIGPKTRELLELIPDTSVDTIERCSGHDGTYAVKKEFHDVSMKIARPVAKKVTQSEADHYTSDCVMAAQHISNTLADDGDPEHPISLIRKAYGI